MESVNFDPKSADAITEALRERPSAIIVGGIGRGKNLSTSQNFPKDSIEQNKDTHD